jgi:DNA-binding CsgD family transcriptional regulator
VPGYPTFAAVDACRDRIRQMTEVHAMAENGGRAQQWLLVAALVVLVAGGSVDLVLDRPSSWRSAHVLFELGLIVASATIAIAFSWGWWRAERSLAETRHVLEERQAERDEWLTSARAALAGLGQAMDERFERWGLTSAEREVALQLLKGRSHKAIAYATGRSERTVRQHAVTVYEKSGLSGRAELAAFFLEDLMLPRAAPESGPAHREPPAA